MCLNFLTILEGIIETIIGGSVLTVIIFLIKEKLYSLPNVAGHWTFKIICEKTKYKPYEKMEMEYGVMLVQKNKELFGTGEKISEKNKEGRIKKYEPGKRIKIKLDGYIYKNYFSKDRIMLHIEEHGAKRVSNTIHNLIYKKKKLIGDYISNISDSSGKVGAEKSIPK